MIQRSCGGVARPVLDSRLEMTFIRQYLSRLMCIWLLCQVVALGAPVVLVAAGATPVEELCTCPGGDHETCPMHHGTQSTAPDSTVCGMKACSSPVDIALLSMAGGAGVLSSSVQFEYPRVAAFVVAQEPASLDQPAPNHTPPPRL